MRKFLGMLLGLVMTVASAAAQSPTADPALIEDLVAANRIPRRNAELLAYLAQLLLFSQKDVKNEQTIACGYLGCEKIIRDLYVRVGLVRPAQTPPPEAQALLAEPSRV